MASTVLVLNSGSSSLKYQLIEPDSGESLADGTVEQIGEPSSPVTDYGAALRVAFEKLCDDGIDLKACGLAAVGHRVVHGGPVFYRPTVIDDKVIVVDPDVTSTYWDERGIAALRRYYTLKDEADITISESKHVWLDTPYSIHSVQCASYLSN